MFAHKVRGTFEYKTIIPASLFPKIRNTNSIKIDHFNGKFSHLSSHTHRIYWLEWYAKWHGSEKVLFQQQKENFNFDEHQNIHMHSILIF